MLIKQLKYKAMEKRHEVILCILIMLSVIIATVAFQSKEGMKLDEYLTYSLANTEMEGYYGTNATKDYSGIKYNPQKFYESFFSSSGINLSQVWKNQASDDHPPLYYLLIHMLSSIWQGIFTIRPGFIVNIVCHIINIILVYKIAKSLVAKEEPALICTAFFGLSATMIDLVLFVRMYVMLTTWLLLFIYWHLKFWYREHNKRFYVPIALISIGGVLTHYYFVIGIFALCIFWGIRLLTKKQYRSVLAYISAMMAACLISIGIFPGMLKTIFNGPVADDTFNNFGDFLNYTTYLETFGNMINQLSGKILPYLFVFVALYFLICSKLKKEKIVHHQKLIVIFLISLLYYLAISKIAIYNTQRYISPIYPLVIICIVSVLNSAINLFIQNEQKKSILLLLLVVFIIVHSSTIYEFRNLALEHKEPKNIAKQYPDADCVYVYKQGGGHRILANYEEIRHFKSLSCIMVTSEKWREEFDSLEMDGDYFILYMDENLTDKEAILKNFSLEYNMNNYFKLYDAPAAEAYLLEKTG